MTTLKLFVYGTLKLGYNMERLVPSASFICEASIFGYKIYDLGSYPGIVESEDMTDFVLGEVWDVPADQVHILDRYEGMQYIKHEVVACEESNQPDSEPVNTFECTTYVYQYDIPKNAKLLEDGKWTR